MPLPNELEYEIISADWRHRDSLTWQIPSVIVVVGGALIAAAFAVDMEPRYSCILRPMLLGFGGLLSTCLTFALAQNLWYQMGSSEALKRIVRDAGSTIPRNKDRRTLDPRDFGVSKRDVMKGLFCELTGSGLLLMLCLLVTVALFVLLVLSIADTFNLLAFFRPCNCG